MAFPEKLLYNDEQIVIDQHPHWWGLVPRGAGLVAAIALGGYALSLREGDATRWWVTAFGIVAGILVLVALIAFVQRLLAWSSTMFVVTTERCIYRSGIISKKGIEIPLDRISTVFFNQNIFERVIGAGDVGIESAGEGSRQDFSDIRNPSSVQGEIYRQMEAYEDRRQDRLGHIVHGVQAATAAAQAEQTERQPSIPEQIGQLADLHAAGHLSDLEFETKKAELLKRM